MDAEIREQNVNERNKELKPFSVLLVDDEEYILAFVGIKLKMCGYNVLTAHDGAQALELVKVGAPDLVITDLIMPRIDGLQLLRGIRAFSDVPVIVLSAIESHESLVREIRAQTDDYVNKPFNPDDLVARIEAVRKRSHSSGKE